MFSQLIWMLHLMANIWEKAKSILAGNLNSGLSYLITTVFKHCFLTVYNAYFYETVVSTQTKLFGKETKLTIDPKHWIGMFTWKSLKRISLKRFLLFFQPIKLNNFVCLLLGFYFVKTLNCLKVNKSQRQFFLKLHCLQNERNTY